MLQCFYVLIFLVVFFKEAAPALILFKASVFSANLASKCSFSAFISAFVFLGFFLLGQLKLFIKF